MTDKMIAKYLLHIWEIIYQKWVKSNISGTCQSAVENRLSVIRAAVEAGNVPDFSEIIKNYLRFADGTVVQQSITPVRTWTTGEWNTEIQTLVNEIEILENQVAQTPQPKNAPDQECVDFWNSHMTMMIYNPFQQQLEEKQKELTEIQTV